MVSGHRVFIRTRSARTDDRSDRKRGCRQQYRRRGRCDGHAPRRSRTEKMRGAPATTALPRTPYPTRRRHAQIVGPSTDATLIVVSCPFPSANVSRSSRLSAPSDPKRPPSAKAGRRAIWPPISCCGNAALTRRPVSRCRALASYTARVQRHIADSTNWNDLVAKIAAGPPIYSPFKLLDPLVNTSEMFIHHEDVRRAAADWQPRVLDDQTVAALRRPIPLMAGVTLARVPARVTLRTPDGATLATVGTGCWSTSRQNHRSCCCSAPAATPFARPSPVTTRRSLR